MLASWTHSTLWCLEGSVSTQFSSAWLHSILGSSLPLRGALLSPGDLAHGVIRVKGAFVLCSNVAQVLERKQVWGVGQTWFGPALQWLCDF